MRLHRDILFIGVAKNSRYDEAATDVARLAENDWEGLGGALFNYGGTTRLRDHGTPEKHRRSQAFPGVLSRARLCGGSLTSERCSSVLSQKRVPWDSTKTYSPRHSTFWDRALMRRYHVKSYKEVSPRISSISALPTKTFIATLCALCAS